MAESFITQCPHCGTSFRVKTEQLAVANGSVRCGACLQVFSARNHVVTTAIPVQKTPKVTPPAPTPRPSRAAAKAKPTTKPSPARAPAKPTAQPPATKDFGFTTDDDDDAEFLFSDDANDDDEFLFNDGPGDSLFDEDEQDDGLGELSDSFMNLHDSSKTQKTANHFQKEAEEMEQDVLGDDTDDESWAESMLEEIEKEDKISTSKPAVFESRDVSQRSNSRPQQRSTTTTQSSLLMNYENDFTSTGSIAAQVVNKASQEIELDFHADDRLHRLRPLGWVAVLLLVTLLLGQFAWLARDKYARMDQWRGLYQSACDTLGCALPEQIDLEAIRTSVLVREHKDPLLKDIRMVDVVLTNKALFKQPFPTLVMQYTDVNGQLVADQMFNPASYLKGELTGVDLMPVNTRVYISFPIRTPTKNAINYQLILKRSDS